MDELAFALELAEAADEVSMKYFTRDPEASLKKDGSLVTVADKEIEALIRRRIREQFPAHAILGEETGLEGDAGAPIWIIDPIDGTNNYASGIPVFGTLVALRVGGRTEVGVASAPALGERYDAAIGDGARMNGKPIQVSKVDVMADAVICIGSYRRMRKRGYQEQLDRIFDDCRRDRGFGDFWGYMLVAKGAAEVMLEPNLNVWDVAALEVIVGEAGGRASNFAGDPYPESRITDYFSGDGSFIATNGVLHEELVARLAT
ncbi:histidinol-phosphatase [soil metagenome]